LLFLTAVIKAVDDYQDLLRVSVASAGNDHRLGGNEAPPAIVSMFLGDELTELLESLENGTAYKDKEKSQLDIGATVLPHFPKDATDRNRTSPFAFTGNKFEFRMLGSTFSIAGPNVILNTIVAEELSLFADILEKSNQFTEDLDALVKSTIKEHKRIIFNGNNYSDEWMTEASRRGLLNLKTTVDALPAFIDEKNIALFTKHHVYTEAEIYSRYEILMENYCKTIHIEALSLIDMVKKEIIPSVLSYQGELAEITTRKKTLMCDLNTQLEEKLITTISKLGNCLHKKLEALEGSVIEVKDHSDILIMAKFYRERIFLDMAALRGIVDELETLVSRKHWPYPTYAEILYSVK
jgi:glutamine synthetase